MKYKVTVNKRYYVNYEVFSFVAYFESLDNLFQFLRLYEECTYYIGKRKYSNIRTFRTKKAYIYVEKI